MYGFWDMEHHRDNFLPFWTIFALLPPNNPENQNFEKMKKMPGDIIILHLCTINDNHMMYHSWDMECDRQKFLPFCTVFALLPANNPENEDFAKMKKMPGDIIILHLCTINNNHMMYHSWDMECDRQNFLPFCTVFALLPPNNPENQNFEKMKKMPGDVIILHLYHKSYDVWLLRYGAWHTIFVILEHFFALLPPDKLKNQNFQIIKKEPGDIIILQMCTINDNHEMYVSWDMECDKYFFVILHHFLTFYPLKNPKNQNFEKMKIISGDILILHMCTKMKIIWSMIPEIQSVTMFCHFGPFLVTDSCRDGWNVRNCLSIHVKVFGIDEMHKIGDARNG